MSATLYLCATPIGNLGDMTLRALDTLKNVSLILAEDTRQSRKLLNHYGIETPLRSFHAHNEKSRQQEVLERLAAGEDLALVSDAGMPLISDPGADLVREVQNAGFTVTCLPGASAPVTALVLSGLAPLPYCFIGFLPRQSKARKEIFQSYLTRPETLVCFESPHRLLKTLRDLESVLASREMAVCRELSKRFEEVRRGTAAQLLAHFQNEGVRGEITLVIAGALPQAEEIAVSDTELRTARRALEEQGLDRKSVQKTLQQRYGLTRNELYQRIYQQSE